MNSANTANSVNSVNTANSVNSGEQCEQFAIWVYARTVRTVLNNRINPLFSYIYIVKKRLGKHNCSPAHPYPLSKHHHVENMDFYPDTNFGRWIFKRRENVLQLREGPPYRRMLYEIDLDRMTTSAQCLDWIFQATNKTWTTPQDVADLIEAIRATIHPQKNLCSFGVECGPKSSRGSRAK